MFVVLLALAVSPAMAAQRLKDLTNVGGVRPNQLIGYGLVVGLDGSGDKVTSSPFTGQALSNMLNQLGCKCRPAPSSTPRTSPQSR